MDGHQGRVEFGGGVSTGVIDTRGGLNLKAEPAPVTDRWMVSRRGSNVKAESTPE